MTQPRDFGFNDEIGMLKDAARRFFDEKQPVTQLRPQLKGTEDPHRGTERTGWYDRAAWQEMIDLGWHMVAVQGDDEDRSIEETLDKGWELLKTLPERELKRIDPMHIEKYHPDHRKSAAPKTVEALVKKTANNEPVKGKNFSEKGKKAASKAKKAKKR